MMSFYRHKFAQTTRSLILKIQIMKLLSILAIALCMAFSLSACETSSVDEQEITVTPQDSISDEDESTVEEDTTIIVEEDTTIIENDDDMVTKLKITVNGLTLTASLEDNATSRAFVELLPMTLPMLDLYGREMCYRFANALPTDNAYTRGYEVGEIVYYPPRHSFVIMYAQNGERFQMQSIGKVDSGVEIFDGIGDVDVLFEIAE